MRWESCPFLDTTARGRNGWFRAARLDVGSYVRDEAGRPSARVVVDVASERAYQEMPPVHLDMAVEDAVILHNLLGRAVRAGACADDGGDLPPEPQTGTDGGWPGP